MKAFRVLAVASVLTLAAWNEASATTLQISELMDTRTAVLDGTDITSFITPGLVGSHFIGSLFLTNGLNINGAGCNAGAFNECTVVGWDDPNVGINFANAAQTSYSSPTVMITEPGGVGNLPVPSDFVNLTVIRQSSSTTRFVINFNSNLTELVSPQACDATTGVTGCVVFGTENGNFQDVASLLLTPVNNTGISVLPIGGATVLGPLSIQVQSSPTEEAVVPEPATLTLVGLGAAALGLRRRRAARKIV